MLPETFWGRIQYLLQQYGSSFLSGAGNTMIIAIVGTFLGCLIGFIVGIIQTIPVDKRDSAVKKTLVGFLKFIMACYVEFFRGTPMMVQAMFIYYGSAYLFKLGKFIIILKYFCLSFISFLPIFYLNYIYYFGLLIFCCQIVAIKLIITMFLFKSNYYVNFSTPLVILLYLFHTNLLFQ